MFFSFSNQKKRETSVNITEIKRLLSNLMNNSEESLFENRGKISISLDLSPENRVLIIVEDSGCGIPLNILSQIGSHGFSYNKDNDTTSGFGLGLSHARTTIEKWGGNLSIESEEMKGTRIIISLPRSEAPKWFLPKISLVHNQVIVILDDDQGIHQTWDGRFQELDLKNKCVSVIHLSTPSSFKEWIFANTTTYKNALYLSDFELIGFEESGLDLLEKYSLDNAVLVTSHYENKQLQERCEKSGIKLIPKMIAGFVPIQISKPVDHYDYVYIDDSAALRFCWEEVAKDKGINILTLESTQEFNVYRNQISKDMTHIYIDSYFGENEPKGEDFAETLYMDGFKNIYLATGYDVETFKDKSWLNVSGKECPFQ